MNKLIHNALSGGSGELDRALLEQATRPYEADARAWGFSRAGSPKPGQALPYTEQLRNDRMFNCHESIDAMAEVYRAQSLVDDLEGSCVRPPPGPDRPHLLTGLQVGLLQRINGAWADEALRRGKGYMARNDFKAALQCFDQAVHLDESNLEARHQRALALAQLRRTLEAVEDLDRILSVEGGNDRAQVLRRSLFVRLTPEELAKYQRRTGMLSAPQQQQQQQAEADQSQGQGQGAAPPSRSNPPAASAPPPQPPPLVYDERDQARDAEFEQVLRNAAQLLTRGRRDSRRRSDDSSSGDSSRSGSPARRRRRSSSPEKKKKRRKDKKRKKEKKKKEKKKRRRSRSRSRSSRSASRSRSRTRSRSRSEGRERKHSERSKTPSPSRTPLEELPPGPPNPPPPTGAPGGGEDAKRTPLDGAAAQEGQGQGGAGSGPPPAPVGLVSVRLPPGRLGMGLMGLGLGRPPNH